MTAKGIEDLYMWLSVSWPLIVKPNVDDAWRDAYIRNLSKTYKKYTDKEVIGAFQKWAENNEKYPTTKDILNILEWGRIKDKVKANSPETYQMNIITDEGVEYVVQYNGKINFTWNEFLDIPRNKDRLDPDEWERRFRDRRRRILSRLQG